MGLRSLLRSLFTSSVDDDRTAYGEARTQVGHAWLGLGLALTGGVVIGPWGWLIWAPVWLAAEALQWRRGAGLKFVRDALKDGAFWLAGALAGRLIASGGDPVNVWGLMLLATLGAGISAAFVED